MCSALLVGILIAWSMPQLNAKYNGFTVKRYGPLALP